MDTFSDIAHPLIVTDNFFMADHTLKVINSN